MQDLVAWQLSGQSLCEFFRVPAWLNGVVIPSERELTIWWVVSQQKGLNQECDGQVWRVDVGMSAGVLNALPQVSLPSR